LNPDPLMSSATTMTSLRLIQRKRAANQSAAQPLFDTAATRQIEHATQTLLPPHALMERAGLSTARLALALAPHANTVWIACGPGNNGGDGLEAAMHLKQWGKSPVVTWLGTPDKTPADAALSYQRALDAGVTFADAPPADFDFCLDALLGIGASSASPPREIQGPMAGWIAVINASRAPVLAVDVPTGLHADTGDAGALCVRASATLSLVTLKPGLFTAHGRDASGDIWLDTLGAQDTRATGAPTAWLAGVPARQARAHASHKGSFGDVAVIGGAPGMTGAALLAASAALHFGAGRVYVMLLDGGSMAVDPQNPELMFRPFNDQNFAASFGLADTGMASMTAVCGCGGGTAMIASVVAKLLPSNAHAVIDADALNAVAADKTRPANGVDTPPPGSRSPAGDHGSDDSAKPPACCADTGASVQLRRRAQRLWHGDCSPWADTDHQRHGQCRPGDRRHGRRAGGDDRCATGGLAKSSHRHSGDLRRCGVSSGLRGGLPARPDG
jgi:hydroxyethylthiazole kinase-like uncharacterized protein yjeF